MTPTVLYTSLNVLVVYRTMRGLRDRLGEHIYNIKRGYKNPSLSAHFRRVHGRNPKDLKFIGLDRLKTHWRGCKKNHEKCLSLKCAGYRNYNHTLPMESISVLSLLGAFKWCEHLVLIKIFCYLIDCHLKGINWEIWQNRG